MIKSLTKLGVAALLGSFVVPFSTNSVSAISTGHASAHATTSHATPHVSAPHVTTPHVSASHPTTSTNVHSSTSISSRSIPASRGTLNTSSSRISSAHTTKSQIAESARTRLPQTPRTNTYINRAQNSSFYRSLNSSSHRSDYVFWHSYYSTYYTRPIDRYYVWMPYWLWMSNNSDSNKVKQQAHKRNMKWIKVGSKLISVPLKIYNRVKIGDTVELIDNTHIKINGHVYDR